VIWNYGFTFYFCGIIIPQMKKAIKIGLYAIAALLLIGIFRACGSSDTTTGGAAPVTTTETTTSATPKTWTEVIQFSGNGVKKSAPFTLSGGSARLLYDYTGAHADMGGMFSVFVMDKGADPMKEGGIPEVMIDKNEKGESYLIKSAGEYYLYLNAAGNWKVTVEEQK
jgi:hypothetical protein